MRRVLLAVAVPILTLGLLVSAAMFVGGGGAARAASCGPNLGAVVVNTANLPEKVAGFRRDQLAVAATIINVGHQLGISRRGQAIAVSVAIGESSLSNPNHGDAARNDTIGTFQIGPEHGTAAQRLDTAWSAGNFYQRMVAVDRWETMEPTLVGNGAQHNADPYHYAQFWQDALSIVEALDAAQTPVASPAQSTATSGRADAATKYQLGPVRPITVAAVGRLAPMFGVSTVGGYRKTTTVPDHEVGLAADFMVGLTAEGRKRGDLLAAYAQQHAQELGIEYILWSQRSWNPKRGTWRPMADRGSPTENHRDHVHITFVGDKSAGDLVADSGCVPGDETVPVGSGGWVLPSGAVITSEFNPARRHPITGIVRAHNGTDFGGVCESPIRAAAAGRVVHAGVMGTYGHMIEVDHGGGVSTRYAHMYAAGMLARVGDQVGAGQTIGKVGSDGGSTGCHLHFEVRVNGDPVNARDYLNRVGVSVP